MARFFISNLSYRSLLWPPRQKRSPQPRSQRKAPKKPSGTPPTSCLAVLNPRSTIRTLHHSCTRGSRLRDRSPPTRVLQKPLKRREPQRHGDTKFFPSLPRLRPAEKKLPLCLGVFVVQRLYAFCNTLLHGDDGCMGISGTRTTESGHTSIE